MTERIIRIGTIRGLVGGMSFADESDGTLHRVPRWTSVFKGQRVRIVVEEIGETFIPTLEAARNKITRLEEMMRIRDRVDSEAADKMDELRREKKELEERIARGVQSLRELGLGDIAGAI